MRIIDDLNPTQIRILGALLEKEQATPEYYPLTVNALLAACNQKSNRDPVTTLSETELWDELEALRAEVLVWRSDGARVPRWSQSISRRLELDPEEKAVLTVLMLRGPQTVGELRSRTSRLHEFASLDEVEAALHRMAGEERDLVAELPRRPGQKENRWIGRLGGDSEAPAPETAFQEQAESRRTGPGEAGANDRGPDDTATETARDVDATGSRLALADRVASLETRVVELQSAVDKLVEALGGLDRDESE